MVSRLLLFAAIAILTILGGPISASFANPFAFSSNYVSAISSSSADSSEVSTDEGAVGPSSEIAEDDPSNLDAAALSWDTVITIQSANNIGKFTSIAVDNDGMQHIAYYDVTGANLRYAFEVGAGHGGNCGPSLSFKCVTIDSLGNVGQFTDIALDSSDSPFISYYDATNSALKIARNVGAGNGNCGPANSWVCETIDRIGDVGSHASIVIGAFGLPHIAYYDASSGDLKYAVILGPAGGGNCGPQGTWSCTTIDSSGSVGQYTDISINPNSGRTHISYYDATNGNLKYAFSAAGNCGGSHWTCIKLRTAGDVGMYSSIALDGLGNPSVTYYDNTNDNLAYISFAGATAGGVGLGNCGPGKRWDCTNVDVSGNVGSFSELAIDSADRRHASYYDATNGNLKYALCLRDCELSASWMKEVVDSANNVGQYTDIAVDSIGNPHISYYYATGGNLKIAQDAKICDCDKLNVFIKSGTIPGATLAAAPGGGTQLLVSVFWSWTIVCDVEANKVCSGSVKVEASGANWALNGAAKAPKSDDIDVLVVQCSGDCDGKEHTNDKTSIYTVLWVPALGAGQLTGDITVKLIPTCPGGTPGNTWTEKIKIDSAIAGLIDGPNSDWDGDGSKNKDDIPENGGDPWDPSKKP